MPDWVVHLGSAYAVYRPFSKEDLRWVFLGAILPDVFARISSVLADIFHKPWRVHYALEVFHTPVVLCLMALTIALFTNKVMRTWLLVFGASLFHIFMDLCETKMSGYGQLLFYPISYETYQLNIFHNGSAIYYTLLAVSVGLLLWHIREPRVAGSKLRFKHITSGRLILIGVLLAVIFSIPAFAWQSFVDRNVGHELFSHHPEKFENREIILHFNEVVAIKPIKIKAREHIIEVVGIGGYKVGDWISVRGIYQKDKIFPEEIWLEVGLYKVWLSLVGLLLFPFLWFEPKKLL